MYNLYFQLAGDDLLPVIGAPSSPDIGFQVPFQIPAGNKNQLNMLGNGNIITTGWTTVSADIIGDLSQISAASTQLSGYQPEHIWINSLLWPNILLNTGIRNAAGVSNTPFATYERIGEKGYDGMPQSEYYFVLAGLPTWKWHITDDVIFTGGS